MLPFDAWLFTRMKPFAAKIWIGGRPACHTSSSAELTTTVPSRVLSDPAKLRSRRSPAGGAARWIEAGVDAFVVAVVVAAGV
jgi:hypothetical protein